MYPPWATSPAELSLGLVPEQPRSRRHQLHASAARGHAAPKQARNEPKLRTTKTPQDRTKALAAGRAPVYR